MNPILTIALAGIPNPLVFNTKEDFADDGMKDVTADKVTGIKLGDSDLTVVADIGPDSMMSLNFGDSNIDDIVDLTTGFDGIYDIAQKAEDCFLTVSSYDLDRWTSEINTVNIVIGQKVEGLVQNRGNVVDGAKSFYANEASRVAFIGDAAGNVTVLSFDSLLDTEIEIDWNETIDTAPGGMVVHSYLLDEADFGKLTYVGNKKMLVHYKYENGQAIELGREEFTNALLAKMVNGKRVNDAFTQVNEGGITDVDGITVMQAMNPDTTLGQLFQRQLGITRNDTTETGSNEAIETDEAPSAK